MAGRTKVISEVARLALAGVEVDGNTARLTQQLDRKVYLEVNGALSTLGGVWNKKRQAHVFDDVDDDLRSLIFDLVDTGTYERNPDDFFPTPATVAQEMCALAELTDDHGILEPSAGSGAILAAISKAVGHLNISAVEISDKRASELLQWGYAVKIADFLTLTPPMTDGMKYDRVLMNPPFSKGAAVRHVRHAMRFLKTGGRLVAVLPSSIVQRQDREHATLRGELLKNGRFIALPEGTFSESGTQVRTVLVVWDKPNGYDDALDVKNAPGRVLAASAAKETSTASRTSSVAAQAPIATPAQPVSRFKRLAR
jgi:protein-L-isoaspartate O-methyltransferase